MELSNLLKSTRQYFWEKSFDEVEIEYLNSTLPLEPNIYSFSTLWSQSQAKYYLPTSPELSLKKYLADTQKDCFAVSHCFRDLEAEGPHHTKEFLMLEWYEVGKNYLDLMTSVENYINQFYKFPTPFKRWQLPVNLPDNEPDFNQYFLNEIEPNLPPEPVFVVGYPAFLSPLAQSQNGIAQRFELYINRIEIANGCTENRDPASIQKAFESEQQYRQKNHLPTHPFSTDFINYSAKLPDCAGVGLGLSRLARL